MTGKRTFFGTLKAVLWSFVGLRRKKDFDVDADDAFHPLYVLAAALLALAVFIGILLLTVRYVVS